MMRLTGLLHGQKALYDIIEDSLSRLARLKSTAVSCPASVSLGAKARTSRSLFVHIVRKVHTRTAPSGKQLAVFPSYESPPCRGFIHRGTEMRQLGYLSVPPRRSSGRGRRQSGFLLVVSLSRVSTLYLHSVINCTSVAGLEKGESSPCSKSWALL